MGGLTRLAFIAALLVLSLGSAHSAKASEFEYRLGEFNPTLGSCVIGGLSSGVDAAPIGGVAVASYPPPTTPPPHLATGTTQVMAFAEAGRARARVDVSASLDPPSNSFGYGGCAYAKFTIDDIVVSGPSGAQSASLNLDIAGIATGDYASALGSGTVRLHAVRPDQVIRSSTTTNFPLAATATRLTTASVQFMAGDTFHVIVWIQVHGRVGFNAPGQKSAVVDFASLAPVEYGAHLPLSGPVLNLPPGYSVDSIDGNIVDNEYLGGGDPSAVPALGPVGAGLLALALAAGAGLRLRRTSIARL